MKNLLLLLMLAHSSLSSSSFTSSTERPLIQHELSSIQHPSNVAVKPYFLNSKEFLNKANITAKVHSKSGREIIIDPDPTDGTIHPPNYPIDCINDKECERLYSDASPMPTFKPFSQDELDKFLQEYAEKYGKPPSSDNSPEKLSNTYVDDPVNILENNKEQGQSHDKSKSWHLIQAQAHKHPYDDHTGWVTLEPIPWSSSQVQKWEPNPQNRPEIPHWDNQDGGQWNKPSKWQERPWNKPTYEYKPTSKPSHWNDNHNNWNKPAWQENWNSNPDIITDGKPGEFPQDPPSRPWGNTYNRPQSEILYHGQKDSHPSGYPTNGDGRWVLLSSTKGYSYPHRNRAYQRALTINTKPDAAISSHRTVRLTVLPALNGTTNTTLSHGGLLEVEQTFQTVDEAQREHAAKMMRLETTNHTTVAPAASRRSGSAIKIFPMRVTPDTSRKNAMLAAVGAGMIPATMAMLLPMVLGRKKRDLRLSRDDKIPFPNQLYEKAYRTR